MTRSATVLALLLVTLPAAAHAAPGPSERFVAETRAWQQRWAGAVRNERLDPEWIADGRLVYRHDEPGGGWRFLVADAARGVVEPALDHERLADVLSEQLDRAVDPRRLPIARLAASGEDVVVLLDGRAAARAETPLLRVAEDAIVPTNELPPALSARAVRRDRSGSGPRTRILVRNRTDRPVRLVWLDADGQPRPYDTVPAGAARWRSTFVDHVWSIRSDDRELVRVVGTARPTVVDVVESPDRTLDAGAAPPRARRRPADRPPTPRLVLRDGNVHLVTADGERPLTTDGTADDGFHGRVHRSPDGTRAAVMRVRRAPVRTIHFVESRPDDQVQPRLHELRYAKPGDDRDHPRPWVFDLGTGEGRPMDDALLPTPWSLSRVHWIDEDRLRLLYDERGHAVARLVELDAATGAGRTIVEETSDTFVDYPNKIHHHRLRDGRVLWMSQRTGWNHLYLLEGDGAVIRPLTSGDWLVRGVETVDEDAGTVLLRVMGIHPDQDPYHHHFVRVELDTGRMVVLTDADGTHELERSPDGDFYVARHQRVDLPPVTELRRWSDGARLAVLARADATVLHARGWQAPERFVAKGRDGTTDIWGVIFRPTDFDPSLRYPVVEQIYAGPHGHFVPKRWATWHGHREIAERGFVVVQIDGMGTNWRHKAFHDVAHRNLGDSGFPDRIAWLRAAAADRPWMDLSRVGIHGGSAGGQSAVRALIAHPDFYSAAVADCGCHDNRVDKMWWNELWMGWPIGPHYAEQSNVDQAHRLEGDLLLIVGEMDRNVDPASTMQVVDALVEADKDFELLVIPGAGHGAAESPYGRRRRTEFLQRALGGPRR